MHRPLLLALALLPAAALGAEGAAASSANRLPAEDFVPATNSFSLDLGASIVTLGGYAYPKIKLGHGSTPDLDFRAHALGASFRLSWDFVAADLDWRVGLAGGLPGYLGLRGTVGVNRNMGPWSNPRLMARLAGGIELMLAANSPIPQADFLIPIFLGEGELALDIEVVRNRFVLGPALTATLRYGLPAGGGFDAGGWLRFKLLF